MTPSLALIAGFTAVIVGLFWLYTMSDREDRSVSPLQAMWDFATGAPRESVVAVGTLLLGLAMVIAALIRM